MPHCADTLTKTTKPLLLDTSTSEPPETFGSEGTSGHTVTSEATSTTQELVFTKNFSGTTIETTVDFDMTTQTAWNTSYSDPSSSAYISLTSSLSEATRSTFEAENKNGYKLKNVSISLVESQGWCAETQLCFQHTFLC